MKDFDPKSRFHKCLFLFDPDRGRERGGFSFFRQASRTPPKSNHGDVSVEQWSCSCSAALLFKCSKTTYFYSPSEAQLIFDMHSMGVQMLQIKIFK